MEIEEVKLWQWMLAGLIAGVLFSCVVAFNGPGFDTQERDTIEPGEFENAAYSLTKFKDLARFGKGYWQQQGNIDRYHKDQPRLRYLIVHPPISSDPEHRCWITGESYFVGLRATDPTKPGSPEQLYEEWKPFKYGAKSPYEPGYTQHEEKKLASKPGLNAELEELKKALGGKSTFPNVRDYLNAVAAMPNANLKYKFAWWELPPARWSLPPITGFLFIGVAWPLALSVLQNIGVAKRAPVKAPPKQLKQPDPLNIPSTTGVLLQPVKPAPPPPPTSEEKKYGGEFYPVVKVAHHEEKPATAATKSPAATAKPIAPAAKPKAAPVKTK